MSKPPAAALDTEVHLAAILIDGHFYTLCLGRRAEAVLKEFLWPQTRCVGHREAGQFCNKSTVCEEERATAFDWLQATGLTIGMCRVQWRELAPNKCLQADSQLQQTLRNGSSLSSVGPEH